MAWRARRYFFSRISFAITRFFAASVTSAFASPKNSAQVFGCSPPGLVALAETPAPKNKTQRLAAISLTRDDGHVIITPSLHSEAAYRKNLPSAADRIRPA